MPLRWQEVAVPLALIVLVLLLKYVPATAHLPLASAAGCLAFGHAGFLALRLVQAEEAVRANGAAELRPSPADLFAVAGTAMLAGVLLLSCALSLLAPADPARLAAAGLAGLALAALGFAMARDSLLARIRWDHRALERRCAFEQPVRIEWPDVVACTPTLRGVAVQAADGRRIVFGPYAMGAAELTRHASIRARRNGESAARALAAS